MKEIWFVAIKHAISYFCFYVNSALGHVHCCYSFFIEWKQHIRLTSLLAKIWLMNHRAIPNKILRKHCIYAVWHRLHQVSPLEYPLAPDVTLRMLYTLPQPPAPDVPHLWQPWYRLKNFLSAYLVSDSNISRCCKNNMSEIEVFIFRALYGSD